ncbi:uridine kinase [Georgenia sp. 311]|uniref:uridine kinase family protein n=1 Tax=Georgenia sp. 311 TaxID=2585134 RepID=UPI00210010FA|nr:ATP-binding protein [Georgenia sp. 311]
MSGAEPGDAPAGHEEEDVHQPGLFDIPPGARRAPVRIVLLTGPSGSGKTSLTGRLGVPVVSLDDFYRDGDHPDLPRRYGIVDWDDPRSWDHEGALAALLEIARTGRAELPLYDIPTNRRTATRVFDAGGSPIVLAEGIFAAELIADCREEDILADALCLWRPRAQTFWFRLTRDLGEARKPPLTLLRRGLNLARIEPAMITELVARGARKMRVSDAESYIRELAARPPVA